MYTYSCFLPFPKKGNFGKFRSSDGDSEFFDIFAGVLRGDSPISVHNLPGVRTLNIDRFNKRKWLFTKNAASWSYSVQTSTETYYEHDIVHLSNTFTLAESLLHSLQLAERYHVNTNKTKCMCFNQEGNISTLNGGSLKLVDKFTYLGSSVTSTESDINICQTKAWIVIDRL